MDGHGLPTNRLSKGFRRCPNYGGRLAPWKSIGHMDQLIGYQKALKQRLGGWDDNDCGNKTGGSLTIPAAAFDLAKASLPVPWHWRKIQELRGKDWSPSGILPVTK